MSKNKFRLTKQEYNGCELVSQKKVEYNNDKAEVVYYNKSKKLPSEDVIDNYLKNVQLKKRFENFKNEDRKTEYTDFIINGEKLPDSDQTIESYKKRFHNDIPYSINISHDEKKQKIFDQIEAKIKNEAYDELIKEIFDMIIGDDKKLFSYKSEAKKPAKNQPKKNKIIKSVNINKFIELLMENKKKYQAEVLKENDEEMHLKLYVSKHICNRIKQEIRKDTSIFKDDGKLCKYSGYSELCKKKKTLNYSEIKAYMYNKYRMNLIDKNKTKLINTTDIGSIELQKYREFEKLTNKFGSVILHANVNLTKDKLRDEDLSFDIFGGRDKLKKLRDVEKQKGLYSRIKKQLLVNTNLDYSQYGEIKLDDENIDLILNAIVEIRSIVLHKKTNVNSAKDIEQKDISKIKEFSNIVINDYSAYKLAILEKYLSNDVFSHFKFEDVAPIIKKSISEEFEILEKNYLPRFGKVLNRYQYVYGNDKCALIETDISFLLNQIYYTDFRKEITSKNVDSTIWNEVYELYQDKYNSNLDERLNCNNVTHLDFYKRISTQISSGNYDEYINIWHTYIAKYFYEFIEKKYKLKQKRSEEKLDYNQKDIIVKFNNEFGHVTFTNKFEKENCEQNTNLVTTIYLLSKLCNRKEINELRNSIKSYLQFVKQHDTNADTELLKAIYKVLGQSLELVDRSVDITDDNRHRQLTANTKDNLQKLIKDYNEENLKIYIDEGENEIPFKQIRYINQQNSVTLLTNITNDLITQDDLKNYKTNKEEIDEIQKKVNDQIKSWKEKIKREPAKKNGKPNKKKYEIANDPQFVEKWKRRNQINFEINNVELYTVRNLHNFTAEIFTLYQRTIKAIERDFMLICDYKGTANKFWLDETILINNLVKIGISEEKLDEIRELRDQVIHMNYYNELFEFRTLEEMYFEIRDALEYNKKRRKSLRTSLEYIFEKNDLELTIYNNEKRVEIESQKHQYAKKSKFDEDLIWNYLDLKTEREVELFKKAFKEGANNIHRQAD